MKIYERYLIKEIFPYTMVGLSVITFVILVNQLVMMAGFLIRNSVSIWVLLRLILHMLPSALALGLPMSILLGVVLGIGRLSAESEITAFRSCGIRLSNFIKPVAVMSIFFLVATMYTTIYLLPHSNNQISLLIRKVITSKTLSSQVKPRVFMENVANKVMYISRLKNRNRLWEDVIIFDTSQVYEPAIIMARQAVPIEDDLQKGLQLLLRDVKIYEVNLKDPVGQSRYSSSPEMITVLAEKVEFEDITANVEKTDRSMTISELRAEIAKRNRPDQLSFTVRNNTPRKRKLETELTVIRKKGWGENETFNSSYEIGAEQERRFTVNYHLTSRKRFAGIGLKIYLHTESGKKVIYNGKETVKRIEDIIHTGRTASVAPGNNWQTRFFANAEGTNKVDLSNFKIGKFEYYSSPAHFDVEIHKRWAIPFSCLIFGLLGLPLGLSSRKAGKSFGYLASIIVFVAFYYILLNSEILADKGRISPILGAWAANIIFFFIAIVMLIVMKKELEPRLIDGIITFFTNIKTSIKKSVNKVIRKKVKSPRKTETAKTASPISENAILSTQSIKNDSSQKKAKLVIQMPKSYLRFPNTIDRYVSRNFLKLFLLVLFILYLISMILQFTEINEDILRNKVGYSILWDYYKYRFPSTMLLLIPISALIATLATFGIMSHYNETVALKAAGISQYRISLPVIIMALFLSLITFTLSENVLPYSKIKYDEVRRKIQKLKPQTMEQHGRQFLFGQPRSDDLSRIYYFYQYNEKDQAFSKISYYDYDPINMRLVKRLSSEGAIWDEEFKGWEFHNGWIQIFNYPGISTEQFVSRIIKLEEEPEYFKRSWHTPDQMSYTELKDLISELRLKGYDPVYEQVQLFWKLAYAVVTLVVVLLGLPFSFSFTNKGSLAGIFISLVIVVIYYPLSNVFRHLGYSAVLPPLMAAWGVNLLFILIALVMFVRMRT